MKDKSVKTAFRYALHLLARREHSGFEIEKKLEKALYPEEIIQSALERLQSQNLINDERFTRQWIQSRFLYKKCGNRRLQQELKGKGISKTMIESLLKEIVPNEESGNEEILLDHIEEIARSRWERARKKQEHWTQSAAKIERYLLGRGFEFKDIRGMIQRLIKKEKDEL